MCHSCKQIWPSDEYKLFPVECKAGEGKNVPLAYIFWIRCCSSKRASGLDQPALETVCHHGRRNRQAFLRAVRRWRSWRTASARAISGCALKRWDRHSHNRQLEQGDARAGQAIERWLSDYRSNATDQTSNCRQRNRPEL